MHFECSKPYFPQRSLNHNPRGITLSNLQFAPGESNVHAATFSPSVVLFWLKTELAATNTRIVSKRANTLFGVIPLGYAEETFPLANTAGVGVEVKFSLGRAFFGVILLIVGLTNLNAFFGYIALILAASLILNAMSAVLKIKNNGGGETTLQVSILEKAKLEQFRNEVNARLFADHQGLRHQETIGLHTTNAMEQQAQMRAQINLQEQLNKNLTEK